MLSFAHDIAPHAPLQQPRGATAAYGSVIRRTEDPRDIEYRVLARAVALLDAATAPGAGPAAMPGAIHENRMVWNAFAADLAGEANGWDESLRARLLSLACWVFAESDRVLRGDRGVQALIDVNRAVMAGLQPEAPPATGAG